MGYSSVFTVTTDKDIGDIDILKEKIKIELFGQTNSIDTVKFKKAQEALNKALDNKNADEIENCNIKLRGLTKKVVKLTQDEEYKMREINDFITCLFEEEYLEGKWYSYEDYMKTISKVIPEVSFTIEVIGEEFLDAHRETFKEGEIIKKEKAELKWVTI